MLVNIDDECEKKISLQYSQFAYTYNLVFSYFLRFLRPGLIVKKIYILNSVFCDIRLE